MDAKSYFLPGPIAQPQLPKPLTIRDILEDLEAAPADDSAIKLGSALRKKRDRKFSLDAFADVDEEYYSENLASKIRNASTSDIESTSLKGSASVGKNPLVNRKSEEIRSLYQKFKVVVDTSEKTNDLLHEIETTIRHFQSENREFKESLCASSVELR